MATVANIFTLKLENKDFNAQLQTAAKTSQDYNNKIANSLLEAARHQTTLINLTKAKSEAQLAGDKESIKSLNQQIAATKSLIQIENQKISQSKMGIASQLEQAKQLLAADKQIIASQEQHTATIKKGEPVRDSQFNHMIRMMRWAGTLAGAYYALSTAWNATIGKGIELGRQIEDMGMGISALTAANTSNISSNGTILNSMDKFRLSTVMTVDTMKQLRKAAIDTPASFSEMAMIFQQAYVSTSKMGQGFGLTVSDITKNTVQLATRMANIAGAIGMPMQKALEETRSLMSGQASGDSLIASLLFGSPAQANEAMRKAQEAGPLGVKKMLDGVMESFDVLAGVDTYSKSLAQAKGAYENLITKMAEPVKNDLSNMFKAIAKNFDETTASGKQNIKDLEDGFKGLYGSITTILKGVALLAKPITATLSLSGSGWVLLAKLFDEKVTNVAIDNQRTRYTPITSPGQAERIEKGILPKQREALQNIQEQIRVNQRKSEAIYEGRINGTTAERLKLNREIVGLRAQENSYIKNINGLQYIGLQYKEKNAQVTKDTLATSTRNTDLEVANIKFNEAHVTNTTKLNKVISDNRKNLKEQLVEEAKLLANPDSKLKQLELLKVRAAIAETYKTIAHAEKDIAKEGDKAASKAETEANKENRRQLSAMEKMQQLHQTEMANAQLEEAASIANFNLDQSQLTVIERLKLRQLDNEVEGLGNELIATNSITDATLRTFEQNQKIEQIYKNRTELSTLLVKLEKGITDEQEKQIINKDRLAAKDFENASKLLTLQAKRDRESPEFERVFGASKISPETAEKAIAAQKGVFSMAMWGTESTSERYAQEKDKLDQVIERIKNQIAEVPEFELKFKISGGDEITKSLAGIADTFQEINTQTEDYDTKIKVAGKDTKLGQKLEEAKAQSQIQGYGQIASAMSSMFAQGSREAEAFRTIEGGLAIVAGARAILTQGSGDPYTAFARIAAMTALVASTLQSAGIAFGGAGGVSTSYDAFASQAVNTGTGSVLGDTKAQSESISNSLELLSDLAKPEFRLMSQMNASLISIDQKIGGLSANILRAGGFAVGEGYVGSSSLGGANQFMSSGVGGLLTGGASLGLLGAGAGAALGLSSWAALGSFGPIGLAVGAIDQLLLGGTLTKFISGAIGSIVNGIFGGDSESNLHDAGITFASQFIDAAITGLQGQSYQVIRTVTDGGWFSGDDESYNSYFGALDEYTRKQFQLVLGNLYDTVVMAGEGLDKATTDIKTNLSDAVVTIGKISLSGKTGEEVQESLTSIFAKIGDDLVREAYATGPEYEELVAKPAEYIKLWYGSYLNPAYTAWKNAETEFNKTRVSSLDAFQQIGEGLFETMTRVATGMEEAEYYISRLGTSFEDIVYTDLINKQGNVAFEALRQSILGVDEAIYGVDNGVSLMLDSLTGSAGELYDVYTTLTSLRQILTSTGQEAKYLSSSMVRGAGGINELSEAMGVYLETFFTDQEQFIHTVSVLRNEFDKLGIALPANNVAFRDLVSGIDLSTESGQELYGRVVLLSDGFGEFSTQLTDLYQPVRDLSDAFSSLSGSLGDTITTLLNAQTGTTSPTRNLVGQFWSARGELDTLLGKKGDLTKAEQEKLQGLVGRVSSLSTSIQSSVIGANTAMTSSLVSELSGVKDTLDLQNTVLKTIILNGDGLATDIATEGTLTQLVGALSSAGLLIPTAILPSFDVGTPYVTNDMTANIHQGEMVIDAQASRALRKYGIPNPSNNSGYDTRPILGSIYNKIDEMTGYMKRLDRNFDTVMQGNRLRTVL